MTGRSDGRGPRAGEHGNGRRAARVVPDMKIDIWSDVACPWCYLGSTRLHDALSRFPHAEQVQIAWHSYQLDPSLPEHYDGTETDYLSQRKGMPAERVREMHAQMTELGTADGLAFAFDDVVVANSWRAHRLIQHAGELDRADEQGTGPSRAERLEHELFVAHFEQGRDIGDVEELVRVAESAGLDAEAAREAVTTEEFDDRIREDVQAAQMMGAQGVPFFVLEDQWAIPGAVETTAFEEALASVWEKTHQAPTPVSIIGPTATDGACGPDGC